MKTIFAITKKEIIDNIRDKRAFYTALLYPIGFPLYLAFVLYMGVSLASVNLDKESDLYVSGAENAPNLIQYLEQNNFKIIEAPDNFINAVEVFEIDAVLEIKPEFKDRLREGLPAPLDVYMSESATDSDKAYNKIRTIINRYSNSINQRRLMVRGLDVNLFDSIEVNKTDVSKEGSTGRAQGLMIPMSLIISILMGGFYLAVEVTAGEKEKHTLEPLLSLPSSRLFLVLGKYFALLAFCLFSLFLGLAACLLVFGLMPADKIPSLFNFDTEIIAKILLVLLPLTILIAALLMVISSFTKSTKEAQAYLGGSIFLFLAPAGILMFKNLSASLPIIASPVLGQFKLLDMIFKDETILASHYLLSVGTTTLLAVLLIFLSIWLYKQDRILQ